MRCRIHKQASKQQHNKMTSFLRLLYKFYFCWSSFPADGHEHDETTETCMEFWHWDECVFRFVLNRTTGQDDLINMNKQASNLTEQNKHTN